MKKHVLSLSVINLLFGSFAGAQIQRIVDTDNSSTVYYFTGKSPNSWLISTYGHIKGAGATVFVAAKVIQNTPNLIQVKCSWYENLNDSGTILKRTAFTYDYSTSHNFFSSAKLGLSSSVGSVYWLQTLDSLCMYKSSSASISKIKINGSYFEPAEVSNASVIWYFSSSGAKLVRVIPR